MRVRFLNETIPFKIQQKSQYLCGSASRTFKNVISNIAYIYSTHFVVITNVTLYRFS
jgi:hypothetical protein